MSNILTITRCGQTSEYEIDGNAAIIYNGSTLHTLTAGQTKTLQTASTRCATDIVIGGKTLQCGGMVMTYDVTCSLREKPTTATVNITGSGYYGSSAQASVQINGVEYHDPTTLVLPIGTQITMNGWGNWLNNARIYVNGTDVAHSGSKATYTITLTKDCTIEMKCILSNGKVYYTD